MKRFALILILGLLTAVGYEIYQQNHLSLGLRQTLIAAFDQNNSKEEILSYLHEAVAQVHTQRDSKVEGEFQQLIELAKQQGALDYQIGYDSVRVDYPEAGTDAQKLRTAAEHLAVLRQKHKENYNTLKNLINDLRSDVNLPPQDCGKGECHVMNIFS